MKIDTSVRDEIKKYFDIDVFGVDEGVFPAIIQKAQNEEDLTQEEAVIAMSTLMSDDVEHESIGRYLTALYEKGETEREIAASAQVMRIFAANIYTPENKRLFDDIQIIDCCGTGGGVNLFNVSTVVSIILAASGLYVAKHGNRAITSQSGSADFLEEIGVKIDIPPEKVGECILRNHIGFLFAPLFHRAMKNVQAVRRSLPHKTIFNILGPLTNPAEPDYQVIGVYNPDLTELMARVLKRMGIKRAAVFHGLTACGSGMDEVSTLGETKVSELRPDGTVTTRMFNVKEVGLEMVTYERLRTGSARELSTFLLDILYGVYTGPEEEIIALNASFGLYIGGKAATLSDGVRMARELMQSGRCRAVIENFIDFTNKC